MFLVTCLITQKVHISSNPPQSIVIMHGQYYVSVDVILFSAQIHVFMLLTSFILKRFLFRQRNLQLHNKPVY